MLISYLLIPTDILTQPRLKKFEKKNPKNPRKLEPIEEKKSFTKSLCTSPNSQIFMGKVLTIAFFWGQNTSFLKLGPGNAQNVC